MCVQILIPLISPLQRAWRSGKGSRARPTADTEALVSGASTASSDGGEPSVARSRRSRPTVRPLPFFRVTFSEASPPASPKSGLAGRSVQPNTNLIAAPFSDPSSPLVERSVADEGCYPAVRLLRHQAHRPQLDLLRPAHGRRCVPSTPALLAADRALTRSPYACTSDSYSLSFSRSRSSNHPLSSGSLL